MFVHSCSQCLNDQEKNFGFSPGNTLKKKKEKKDGDNYQVIEIMRVP
jgi:hypothetical protein